MKGKIDDNGTLSIERAGRMKEMECALIRERWCSDNCPHFGEPYKDDGGQITIGNSKLDICHGKTLLFDSFTDERKK